MIKNIYSYLNDLIKDPFITQLHLAGITPHDSRMTLYKYVSVDTAIAILQNCSIKFSSPLIFNDPFEMNLGFLDYEVTHEELTDRMIKVFEGKNKKLTEEEIHNLKNKMKIEDLIAPYRKGFEVQKQQTLLFCTSRSFESTLMWSHYADSHKGVCIGLKMPTIYPDYSMFTFNVNYVSEIKLLKALAGTDAQRSVAFFTWINTKSKVWEYEKEVRTCIPSIHQIEVPHSLYSYVSIDASYFEEIYFGAGIDPKDKKRILDLVKDLDYSITKFGSMSISKSTFDLVCS